MQIFILHILCCAIVLAVPVSHILKFVAFFFITGKALSTVEFHLSAIAYAHPIQQLFVSTTYFVVQALLHGFASQ